MNSLATFVLLLPTLACPGQTLVPREPDELLLQQAGLAVDAEALETFVRLRVSPPALAVLREAVASARTGSAPQRAAAHVQLLAAGGMALPYVQRAGREHEDETGDGLRLLARIVERESGLHTTAVIRLLVRKTPETAAAALLALIPTAEEASVLGEIRVGLTDLARQNASASAALRKALEDPLALRRAVSIEALALALPNDAPAAIRPLLNDPVPVVRLRAALALARTQEEAVARLIALLVELPLDLAQEAEEFLHSLALDGGSRPAITEKPESREPARDAWQKWWAATTPESLLLELRKRTLLEEDHARTEKLIRQLGAEEFDDREKASGDLKTLGPRVRSMLRAALKNEDAEIVQRVRTLLDGMARDNVVPLPSGVPRLLALRRPVGATEAMLAYLPFNEDISAIEELVTTLEQIARARPADRKPLLAALEDPFVLRRQVALEALGRVPGLEKLDPLKRRLDDADVGVRLRAGLALIRQGERSAIPAVLGQIGQAAALDDERLLDDFLTRLCEGLTRPATVEGAGVEARKKRQADWLKWYGDNEAQVALPRYEDETAQELVRNLGITLAVLNGNGTVVGYDSEFRVRWQLRNLTTPFDAQMLAGERVLVTEHDLRRVTERNLQGDVLWEKKVLTNPIQAERLPSGNTFIVCRDRLLEVTRTGREVMSIPRPMGDIYSARKLRDGSITCLSNQGRCFRLDARGTEISGFRLPNGLAHLANDLLPNGGALVPISYQNKITEFDRDGKVVKEHTFATPIAAQRLSHGGMLVINQQWPPKMIELDRTGQVIREATLASNALRAVRR